MAGNRTLTRADLAAAVYREVGLSYRESAEMVDTVIDELCDTLTTGETVKISSFGSFTIRDKEPRMGRNLRTREEVMISKRRVVVFRASPVLKRRLNKALSGSGSKRRDT